MKRVQSPLAATLGAYCLPLSLIVSLSGPACSSSSPHPSLIASDGGSGDGYSGGSAGAGLSGGNDNAGAGGDAGDTALAEGGASDAGYPGDGAAGRPVQPGPSLCGQSATWSAAASVDGVSAGGTASLLSVTADELDLAFRRGDALYVAHRSSLSAAFIVGSPIAIPAGWSAAQGAALSSDGKRLVLVSDPDQKKLGELTRSTRGQAFAGAVDESAFSTVNQNAIYTGKIYASPVVSTGDDRLYFNAGFPDAVSTIVVSTRTPGTQWAAPITLTPLLFDGGVGQRRLPTGISADERTLFYFNEESSHEEARFRASSALTSALYDMLSLGKRRGATPNSGCDRLYSESDGDVVVEKD